MTESRLPVPGAGMPIARLEEHRDRLLADQRAVEI
jgi:hypothetical protein